MPAQKRPGQSITIIGTGNLASVLGVALKRSGYKIDAIVSRNLVSSRRRAAALARKIGAAISVLEDYQPQSDIVWLCHTDDALMGSADLLSRRKGWKGRIIFHSSGALTSDVLAPLRNTGASAASFHPMMTFAPGTMPSLQHVMFAVEGDRKAVRAAREIAVALKSGSFIIRKSAKVLYHVLGSLASPLLVAELATAERVGRAAGLSTKQTRNVIGPILRQTLDNYLKLGAAKAYGGPMKRGDVNTVRRHLSELQNVRGAEAVYRSLVQSALLDLPANNQAELLRLISRKGR